MDGNTLMWFWIVRLGAVVILVVAFIMGIHPIWNVWSSEMDGEAVLAHAHAARMVLVTQAEAERDAAVKRAEAIKIVGQAAKDYPEYRTQEFIGAFAESLKDGKITQIIYVPTEANIPVLEAGRFRDKDIKATK
jgi:hypothetical protein